MRWIVGSGGGPGRPQNSRYRRYLISGTDWLAGSFRSLLERISSRVEMALGLGCARTSAEDDVRVPGPRSAVLAVGFMDVPLDDDGSGG